MNIQIPKTEQKRVVVVGAGFGGINVVKRLLKLNFQVVLIDKNNYHTFQPLLYQVATAGLEAGSIAFPVRRIFKRVKNFYFRMAEVLEVKPESNLLNTSIGELSYDYLVIATGGQTNFFDFECDENDLMQLKSVPNAIDLRSYILQNFERALIAEKVDEQDQLMNIVIVGGGPTGVEMAGALGEMKKYVIPKDYPELNANRMHIYLVEMGNRLLSNMTEKSSKKAHQFLNELGVNVLTNIAVKKYDGVQVFYGDNHILKTKTLIWTAGLKGVWINGIDESMKGPGGRIVVDEYNKLAKYDNVFAIGDASINITKNTPRGFPQVAPVAVQQGKLLADNISRMIKGVSLKPFIYTDKGTLATVGRNRAVADFKNLNFQGTIAWMLWLTVHIFTLVGFRNKLIVFTDWIYNYFTYDRALRVIIRPYKRKRDE